jgi:hypothetical protein
MTFMHGIGSQKEFSTGKATHAEHELLVAILDRAVLDYYSKRDLLRLPAEEWLFTTAEVQSMFSFDWICEHLDLDPEAVRKRVAELELSSSFAQSHRWLRRKVQSGSRPGAENDDEMPSSAAA